MSPEIANFGPIADSSIARLQQRKQQGQSTGSQASAATTAVDKNSQPSSATASANEPRQAAAAATQQTFSHVVTSKSEKRKTEVPPKTAYSAALSRKESAHRASEFTKDKPKSAGPAVDAAKAGTGSSHKVSKSGKDQAKPSYTVAPAGGLMKQLSEKLAKSPPSSHSGASRSSIPSVVPPNPNEQERVHQDEHFAQGRLTTRNSHSSGIAATTIPGSSWHDS